jgi:hypothetical protein
MPNGMTEVDALRTFPFAQKLYWYRLFYYQYRWRRLSDYLDSSIFSWLYCCICSFNSNSFNKHMHGISSSLYQNRRKHQNRKKKVKQLEIRTNCEFSKNHDFRYFWNSWISRIHNWYELLAVSLFLPILVFHSILGQAGVPYVLRPQNKMTLRQIIIELTGWLVY